jgi:YidC/Oxa1 family membrane protein insertase
MFSVFAQLADQSIAGIAGLLTPAFGVSSAAVAIVVVTIAVRLLLLPVAYSRHRGEAIRTALASQAAAVREKYPAASKKLTIELTALYQSRIGRMLACYLPMVAQIPVLTGIYQAVVLPAVHGHATFAAGHALLGAHLLTAGAAPAFLLVIAVIAAVAAVSVRVLRAPGPRPTGFAGALARVIPFAPVVMALFLPVAAGIYLAASTAWTVAETAALRTLA